MSATTLPTGATLDERNGYIIEGLSVLTDLAADISPTLLVGLTQLALAFQDFVEQVNEQFGTDLDVATQESRQELQETVYTKGIAAALGEYFATAVAEASETVQV